MGNYKVRIRKETYELLREESEKRGVSMSELIHEAVKWFMHGHYPYVNSGTINHIDRVLSEIENLKRDLERIKQFLTRKFAMEFYTSKS